MLKKRKLISWTRGRKGKNNLYKIGVSKYSYSRNSKDAKEILKFCNNDLSIAIKEVYNEYSRAKYGRFDWRLSTIIKRWTRELK